MTNKYGLTKIKIKEHIRQLREEYAEGEFNIKLTKVLNDLERRLQL